MGAHKFCPATLFCTVCGVPEWAAKKGERSDCDVVGNLTGVSHVIELRRLAKTAGHTNGNVLVVPSSNLRGAS